MNKAVVDYVKKQLGSNVQWATRAIVKLYEHQTMDEQISQNTRNVNGVGFNGTDAFILSSFAEQINRGRSLSAKQLAIAYRKLPKYSRQVISMIPPEKMTELEKQMNQY